MQPVYGLTPHGAAYLALAMRKRVSAKTNGQKIGRDEGTLNSYITHASTRSWRGFRSAAASSPFTALLLLGCLSGCGTAAGPGAYGVPNELVTDQQMMKVTTSPIPGATAKVFPAPPGTQGLGGPANFCVTDAGYCPLAAATPAGQNCLCAAGNLMYGGKTGTAPQTHEPP